MGFLDKLGLGSGASASKEPKAGYTCEMHPDVHMDKPGKCPKCGMELTLSKDMGKTPNTGKKGSGRRCC